MYIVCKFFNPCKFRFFFGNTKMRNKKFTQQEYYLTKRHGNFNKNTIFTSNSFYSLIKYFYLWLKEET